MKAIFTFIFIFFFQTFVDAQSEAYNFSKYWKYRDRFLEGFVRIGPERGESIPVAGRSPHLSCSPNYLINTQRCPQKKGEGMLFWGDSTIELGNYMAVLAMMIRNLKDANQPYKKEAEELFYAIKAFERLDANAETFFGKEKDINGFFIRDDVPEDFFLEDNERSFRKSDGKTYDCLVAHGACKLDDPMDGSIASLDQIMNLLFGFAFVFEMIPEVEHNNIKLSEFAAIQVDRIATHLKDNDWKIKNPEGTVPHKHWGGNCISLSYCIAATAERMNKEKGSYQNKRSKGRGKIILGTFNWAHGIQHERNLWMAYVGIITSGRWNTKKITRRAFKSNREMYALAYSAINHKPLHKNAKRSKIEDILNSAPIDGPCVGTPDCKEVNGWKCSDRWIHSKNRNGDKYGTEREFNGLDYMLLYNLYHYFYKDSLPLYQKPSSSS